MKLLKDPGSQGKAKEERACGKAKKSVSLFHAAIPSLASVCLSWARASKLEEVSKIPLLGLMNRQEREISFLCTEYS